MQGVLESAHGDKPCGDEVRDGQVTSWELG